MVKYRLEWTFDGVRHHSEYKSQAIAEACFEECSLIKSHTDVTLLEIATKVLRKSEERPRLRCPFSYYCRRNLQPVEPC